MTQWTLLLGRLLFGGFFLYSGINHLTNVGQVAGYAASHGVPSPELAVIVSGLMLVFGGLSVLLGLAPRIGLALIIAFLVPVTFAMHPFWDVTNAQQRMMEMVNFTKNLALTGAALGLMAVPVPWPVSVDERLGRRYPQWIRFQRPAHLT
jgi:putative oxidoreductase